MQKSPRLIVPLTKSPHSGRIGKKEWQDWYRGLALAKKILRPGVDKILVVSDVKIKGEKHEADIYVSALQELNVDTADIVVIKSAQETIGQIDVAKEIGQKENLSLVFISTWTHYLRVRWITFFDKIRAKHFTTFGIPRPREAFTDLISTFLFPLIDILGLRKKFKERVSLRRKQGRF